MERYNRYSASSSCGCGDYIKARPSRSVQYKNYESCEDGISVGMAYVPAQKFVRLYTACEALERGTLFEELYKPYCAKGGCRYEK